MSDTNEPRPRFIFEPLQQGFNTEYVEYMPGWFRRDVNVSQHVGAALKLTEGYVKNGLAKVGDVATIGGLWQQVRFGEARKLEQSYRGYLMVEPESMLEAVTKLTKLAEYRLKQSASTDFKWLISLERSLGVYRHLEDDDGRIVLYGDSKEEILEILQALVDSGWDDIERFRIEKFGGDVIKTPRRPGSSEFRDRSGNYWRSLNYNNTNLPSEDMDINGGEGRPTISRSLPPRQKFTYNHFVRTPDSQSGVED